MEIIITKGQIEDIEVIAQFQLDMAMESEDTLLDKDTVTYRRQGIYKSMYHAVCADAKKQNVAQVRLYVDKTNIRGQKVYSSLGMQESHYLIYETTLL